MRLTGIHKAAHDVSQGMCFILSLQSSRGWVVNVTFGIDNYYVINIRGIRKESSETMILRKIREI